MAETKVTSNETNFSGTVQSYVNGGSAGGTFYYVNLGGIKLLWGSTASITVGGGTESQTILTFPTSFFSSIQLSVANPRDWTGSINIFAMTKNATTTGLTVDLFNQGGGERYATNKRVRYGNIANAL